MKTKKVIAPVRIDFAGGTTDIYPFTKIGGAVLNVAINKYVVGKLIRTNKKTELKYSGNIPTSSGLGTSGVMNLVWLALISEEKNKLKLAEKVYNLEQALRQTGGKQDQYASALGGINFLEFKNNKVKVTQLKLKSSTIKELENNLVLVYTGKPHYASTANKSMMDNLLKGKTKQNLIEIKKIAYKMKKALEKSDLPKFAELMNKETEQRKKLHKNIVPKRLEKFIEQGKNNSAIAAKILGSGAGGSILFFGDKKKLKKKFKKNVIDFKFDWQGLRWI